MSPSLRKDVSEKGTQRGKKGQNPVIEVAHVCSTMHKQLAWVIEIIS